MSSIAALCSGGHVRYPTNSAPSPSICPGLPSAQARSLLCFREQWPNHFRGPRTMRAFMWQDDLLVLPDSSMRVCERPLRVNHLVSLVWLEEMYKYDDDDVSKPCSSQDDIPGGHGPVLQP